jgi:hypothetical protein
MARRVEGGVRNDWSLIPALRNLTAKWAALTGDGAAVKHTVDREKPGNVHAAELSHAAASLYKRLQHGKYNDGQRLRKINYDVSKLRYATNLTDMEKKLVEDWLSRTVGHVNEIKTIIENDCNLFVCPTSSLAHVYSSTIDNKGFNRSMCRCAN